MHRVESRGSTAVERVLSLVLLGDLVSLYLAVLRGVDPTPVAAIERLKTDLGVAGAMRKLLLLPITLPARHGARSARGRREDRGRRPSWSSRASAAGEREGAARRGDGRPAPRPAAARPASAAAPGPPLRRPPPAARARSAVRAAPAASAAAARGRSSDLDEARPAPATPLRGAPRTCGLEHGHLEEEPDELVESEGAGRPGRRAPRRRAVARLRPAEGAPTSSTACAASDAADEGDRPALRAAAPQAAHGDRRDRVVTRRLNLDTAVVRLGRPWTP